MMRPTFLGFEASRTALYAAQKSLDVTGHNLSNVNTVGYTRQRVDQTSNSAGGYITRYAINQSVYAGMGVSVNGVQQLRSAQLDQAFRNEYKYLGYYDKTSTMMDQIQTKLQELDEADGNGYGLRNAVGNIYKALQDFSYYANDSAQAAVVAGAFDSTCKLLNQKYNEMKELEVTFREEFTNKVDRVNTCLREIAELNKSIQNSVIANNYVGEFGPNELYDKRNLLLDELSKYGDVKVREDPMTDRTKGTLAGVIVDFNGRTVVQGETYDKMLVSTISDGYYDKTQVNWRSTGDIVAPGMGELKGYLDMLNGVGPNPMNSVETTMRGFPYYIEKLNSFAVTLAETFNSIMPKTLTNAETGLPYDVKEADGYTTAYRNFFGAMRPDGTVLTYDSYAATNQMHADEYRYMINAGNISISNALRTDPTYLIYDKNSTNNEKVLEMINNLINEPHNFERKYGRDFDAPRADDYWGTFEGFISDYCVTLGKDLAFSENKLTSSTVITQEILNSRDAVMGVNETEETTNMLVFNRAFQAAAKMMNTMDGILDVIINQMGRG